MELWSIKNQLISVAFTIIAAINLYIYGILATFISLKLHVFLKCEILKYIFDFKCTIKVHSIFKGTLFGNHLHPLVLFIHSYNKCQTNKEITLNLNYLLDLFY